MDLAAWLRQQIDADVEDARESPEWSQWMIPPSRMAARVRKVLDECDTKRRIIAECQYWYDKVERGEDYPALADRFEVAFGILRLLALPYRDRPGYLEVWAPDGR